ncbi:hypothetical protein PRZ48_011633 [Zasmidium cellare]|uniref:Uncharacterized protein n=1 Tax=Zasmidium cellare TaxID=395010 RepID=A0ABR0E7E9_ZASCE|nr:hypothetical protein PRZ48_011633 [Zasmidium cellare]
MAEPWQLMTGENPVIVVRDPEAQGLFAQVPKPKLCRKRGLGGFAHGGDAVAEEGVRQKDVAHVLAKNQGVPAESKSPEEAFRVLGVLSNFVEFDNPTSSERSREDVGWEPNELGLLEDMNENHFVPGATSKFLSGLSK